MNEMHISSPSQVVQTNTGYVGIGFVGRAGYVLLVILLGLTGNGNKLLSEG